MSRGLGRSPRCASWWSSTPPSAVFSFGVWLVFWYLLIQLTIEVFHHGN